MANKKQPENVVEVESVGYPEPQHDTRDAAQEPTPEPVQADTPDVPAVSVEVNDKPVPVEEDKAEGPDPEVEKAPEDLKENESEASTDVLFADVGLSVHILMNDKPIVDTNTGNKMYDVRGQVLAPGDIVPLTELPPYLVEDVKAGKVPGARIVSAEEAFRLNREAALIRAVADQTIGVESDAVTEIVNPVPVV